MKWLKLDVDYADDDKVCELARKIGSDAARSFWPMLMGYVYKHMGETPAVVRIRMKGAADRDTGERTLMDLSTFVHSFPKVVTIRLNLCAELGLIDKDAWSGKPVETPTDETGTLHLSADQSPLNRHLIDTQVPITRYLFVPNILKRLKVALKNPEENRGKPGGDIKILRDLDKDNISTGDDGFEARLGDAFEAIWKRYPNPDGKKDALRHFRASVKSDADVERINTALTNYIAYLAFPENTDWLKAKQGKTWFNNWQDWEAPRAPAAGGGKNGGSGGSGTNGRGGRAFQGDDFGKQGGLNDLLE